MGLDTLSYLTGSCGKALLQISLSRRHSGVSLNVSGTPRLTSHVVERSGRFKLCPLELAAQA